MTTRKPLLLDLFCGAGGAAAGYAAAGFEVVGVDIKPQRHFPYDFIEADALGYLSGLLLMDSVGGASLSFAGVVGAPPIDYRGRSGRSYRLSDFAVIHASPPCQAFTSAQVIRGREHPDLLTPARVLLQQTRKPWVIENVMNAPMRPDVVLCGSMFGLETKRHRQFELDSWLGMGLRLAPDFWAPPTDREQDDPSHTWKYGRPVGVYGHTGSKATGNTSGNHGFLVAHWREAMGVEQYPHLNAMSRNELAQAIPPAYTAWLGARIIDALGLDYTPLD